MCADTSKNNVEQSRIPHDWHKCISVTLWGKSRAPAELQFKFLCWGRVRCSPLCEQNLDLEILSTYRTVVTIIYHSTAHILPSLPIFFLLTLPFPMSRLSSQPGDTGNSIYCNTSILSVLSPLLPPLIWADRPHLAPLPVGYSGEDLLWRPAALTWWSVWLTAELRAGCLEFTCKVDQLVKLTWNVTTQYKRTMFHLSYKHSSAPFLVRLENWTLNITSLCRQWCKRCIWGRMLSWRQWIAIKTSRAAFPYDHPCGSFSDCWQLECHEIMTLNEEVVRVSGKHTDGGAEEARHAAVCHAIGSLIISDWKQRNTMQITNELTHQSHLWLHRLTHYCN